MLKRLINRMLRGKYYSLNQLDRKLEKFVNYDGGDYVELGANDGVTQSNSLYFEKHRKWKGLLIEPSPHNFLKCRQNRSSINSIYRAAYVLFCRKTVRARLSLLRRESAAHGLLK